MHELERVLFLAALLEYTQVAAHREVQDQGGDELGSRTADARATEQADSLRREVLGDDRRPPCRIAPGAGATDPAEGETDEREQSTREPDAREGAGEKRFVPRNEGGRLETHDQGEALVSGQRAGRRLDPPAIAISFAGDASTVGSRLGAPLQAAHLPGEAAGDGRINQQGCRDVAKGLIPAGAIHFPVELVVVRPLRNERDVCLAVGDSVGVGTVHEVICGDGELQIVTAVV